VQGSDGKNWGERLDVVKIAGGFGIHVDPGKDSDMG
jgi:hypothetical protein